MRTLRMAMLAALTLAVAACSDDDDDPGRPSRVTILFTTDEHSHLFAFGNEGADWPLPASAGDGSLKGGVARRATILNAERLAATRRGGDSVVVSSGDFSHGTLAAVGFVPQNANPDDPETGNPDLGIMYALGYDVVAIGNHEFDWGPAALAGAVHPSSLLGQTPPLVLTNVVFDGASPADDALAALYGERGSGKPITRSHVTTTIRGIRVGFVSSMGFDAARASAAGAPVHFGLPLTPTTAPADFLAAAAEMIQAEVDALRAEGVDAVVLLGHGGVSKNPAVPGDDERLAALLSGVDLVLAGHTHLEKDLQLLKDADGRDVPVVAAAPLGLEVGKVELMLHAGGRATLVEDQTAFVPVDSRTVPAQAASSPIPGALTKVIAGIEAAFLPGTLSLITGGPVTDDPAVAGDLYFRKLCATTFPVIGLRQPGETNALNLDTDAMLALANGLGLDTEIALQNSGGVRADFFPGDITMADVYRMSPLGADPTTGTPGYPLVRVFISTAELRAAFEATLAMAYPLSPIYSPDYYISPAGLEVAYDPTRPPFNPDPAKVLEPGWVTKMELVAPDGSRTVLYDESVDYSAVGLPPDWAVNPAELRSLVSTYYVASFAQYFGITLRDETGTPLTSLTQAILKWTGTAHTVKDHQSLGRYLNAACAATGELPASYEEPMPKRVLCEGAACL
ncbi:MAG TPA: 5'-nucleotidase C-terminal domain-containing protein [Candidatus Sulfomarinibacteraceae bacterium]|nr:5'-nucleotidase C-terminal domain-containing protein [Candidatus Sulfomarinibacteraceae bacterium]